MAVDKPALRQSCQDHRLALSPEIRNSASRRICDFLLQLPDYATAQNIALYAADKGEVDLRSFFERCGADARSCFFPEVVGGNLDFRQITTWSDLVPGTYGILAPQKTAALLNPAQCELIVVPGVAFDRQGNRLGRGKGFYDRYLPNVGGLRVGVCFDACLVEALPNEPHDVRMDVLITESGVMRF